MAKELPYFKFYPGEYLSGDITVCDESTQGVFINVCCYYWMKQGSICLANVKQRFSKCEAQVKTLLEQNILKINSDEKIVIEFLDEQIDEFLEISAKRSESGKIGGKANAKQMLKTKKANVSNIDKIREDKIIEYKDKRIEEAWKKWIDYKFSQFKFKYRNVKSEQTAVNEFMLLCDNDFDSAIKIVDQSIANGWKGLFALKSNSKSRVEEVSKW